VTRTVRARAPHTAPKRSFLKAQLHTAKSGLHASGKRGSKPGSALGTTEFRGVFLLGTCARDAVACQMRTQYPSQSPNS
jgi:hypothetical protein